MIDIPEPENERENNRMARAGIWVVFGVIAALVLVVSAFLAYHPQSVMLAPGKPRPAIASLM